MKKITLLYALLVCTILSAQTMPTIDCPMDITAPVLGSTCEATVTFNNPVAQDLEDGALPVTQTMGLPSGSNFPLGDTIIEFSATDSDNNTVSCQFTITVADTQPPVALCQDFTLQLDANGLATLDPADVDAGSFDTCGVDMLSVSRTDFSCDDLFPAIEDPLLISGIIDGPLTGGTPKAVELYALVDIADLSQYGIGSANNGGGTDGEEFTFPAVSVNAGTYIYVAQEAIEFFNFFGFFPDYVDSAAGINGDDAIELFFNGNVIDTFGDPDVDGTGEVWEYRDGWAYRVTNTLPSPTFNAADWNFSGTDVLDNEINNATATTPFPANTYTYTPVLGAPTIVTLTVTDTSGNTATCDAAVTIEDAIAPTITCPPNVVANTDMGSCTATNVLLGFPVAEDNCFVQSITSDAPAAFPLGDTVVTWTAMDVSGNTSTCTQTVTVNDGIIPTAVCQNITVQLDGNGMVTVLPEDVDGGSTDNCEIASLALSTDTFTCDDIGTNNVALTVTDTAGNVNSCVVTITVEDVTPPAAVCQDITVQLDAMGMATITAADVDGGSTDNCGTVTSAIDIDTFDCTNVGENTVTLTLTDDNGNESSCTAIVTVENNNTPVAVCQDITVQLDANGMATILASNVDGGSTVVCSSGDDLSIDIDTFDCSNVGPNNVTLTVTDANGMTSTCIAVVTVEDLIAPQAICQDITVSLDAAGIATIDAIDVDGGSTDICGIATYEVDIDTFDCNNIGENTVVLTVTDANGNVSSCNATVTVIDEVPPVAVCQDITVSLDAMGMVTITAADVDGGSTDNCAIDGVFIDIDTFDCTTVGDNEVVLTVVDVNGNFSNCTAIVTVVDDVAPMAICQDITVVLDANGMASITPQDLDGGSTDACGIDIVTIDQTTFDCSNTGENMVTLTVTDVNGNIATCTAIVTVEELNATPNAICQNITVPLQADGTVTITAANIDAGSTGAGCTDGLTIDIDTFTCDDIGTPVQVTLTVTNGNGDTDSCIAFVNIVDGLAPVVTCPDDQTVVSTGPYELPDYFATGEAMAIDNCTNPVTVLSQDPAPGTLLEQGVYTITLTAQDDNGFEDECTFVLTVDDVLGTTSFETSLATVQLSPNPATTLVNISNPKLVTINALKIYDLNGRLIMDKALDTVENTTLDVSILQSAMYLVVISSDQDQITKRLVIE